MGLGGISTTMVVVVLDCEWESELAPGSVFISLVLGYIVACPAIYRSLPFLAQHLHFTSGRGQLILSGGGVMRLSGVKWAYTPSISNGYYILFWKAVW